LSSAPDSNYRIRALPDEDRRFAVSPSAHHDTGDSWQVDAQHMFLFIGADPNTQCSIVASLWIIKASL
jgi:hypothetical protein